MKVYLLVLMSIDIGARGPRTITPGLEYALDLAAFTRTGTCRWQMTGLHRGGRRRLSARAGSLGGRDPVRARGGQQAQRTAAFDTSAALARRSRWRCLLPLQRRSRAPQLLTYGATTVPQVKQWAASVEDMHTYAGRGSTRPVMTPSESAIYWVMMIAPVPIQIPTRWARLGSGTGRRYSSMLYVWANQHGEMHPPRHSVHRELALSQVRQPRPTPCPSSLLLFCVLA
jgi:hypothetical protein